MSGKEAVTDGVPSDTVTPGGRPGPAAGGPTLHTILRLPNLSYSVPVTTIITGMRPAKTLATPTRDASLLLPTS